VISQPLLHQHIQAHVFLHSILDLEYQQLTMRLCLSLLLQWNAASLAVSKAAQRKLVHILHEQLAADDIYVAEVGGYGCNCC
jgi:hypothetical protein